jgi:hypothetical protein
LDRHLLKHWLSTSSATPLYFSGTFWRLMNCSFVTGYWTCGGQPMEMETGDGAMKAPTSKSGPVKLALPPGGADAQVAGLGFESSQL